MTFETRRPERPAGGALDEIRCREQRALRVNLLAQPAKQRGEISCCDRLRQIRDGGPSGFEDLRRDQRAERIYREIAPDAVIPMEILHAALSIVGRCAAEPCP